MTKSKIFLILILLLAFALRFWKLDSYPALNADEAAIGYNAYSLIQTGLDEHGNAWPIHFQSFNDYKPGLYFYLALPFVKVMGLNEWAVRIPGAFLGVLTVLLIYLLTHELFKDKKLSLISALFLAISPWHLQFSRGGWEVNTATFFIVLGTWLFIKFVNGKKGINLILSLLAFSLSMYCYDAARVVVPLLGFGLITIYKREVLTKTNLKIISISLILSLLALAPLAKDVFSSNVLSRAAGVGLFADKGPINRINEQRGEHLNLNSIFASALHNKLVNFGLAFGQNWAAHYHGEFLFLTGDSIQRNKVPDMGEMYLTDILFLAAGLMFLARSLTKSWKFILWWLIVAPVAAALTFQAPHALRAENMVIPLVIISAFGFSGLISFLNQKNLKAGIWLLSIIVIWMFARYEHMYWVHMSKEFPYSSQYGVKELVTYLAGVQGKYEKVWITDRYDQPYILFLFYSKYSPIKFQESHTLTSRDDFGFSTVRDIGKFHFEKVDFDFLRPNLPGSLIIGTPLEIPKEANIVKRIYGANGYEYFDVVGN